MSDETVVDVKEEKVEPEKFETKQMEMTPELASMIEKQVSDRMSAYETVKNEEMNSFKEQYKKDYLLEQEQLQVNKEKEGLISQITSNDDLKKKFDEYGIDYNNLERDHLNNYVKIWGSKKVDNSAAPEGQKIDNKIGTVQDAIKGANKKMEELFNGGK